MLSGDLCTRARSGLARLSWPRIVAILAVVAASLVIYQRQLVGLDFYDEAFSAVLPYRFFLGDHPFVDESSFIQPHGLLIYPFFAAFLQMTGSADGIILFSRFLYVLVATAIAFQVYVALRNEMRNDLAILVSVGGTLALYVRVTSLTYYTLATTLLPVGLIFLIHQAHERPRPGWVFLAGLAHGLAILSYPPVIVVAAVSGLLWCAFPARERRLVSLAWFVAGGLSVGLVFAVLGGSVAFETIFGAVKGSEYSRPTFHFWDNAVSFLGVPYKYLHGVLGLIFLFLLYKKRKEAMLWVALTPLWAFVVTQSLGYEIKYYSSYWSFFGPLFFLFTKKTRFEKLIFFLLWVPGMLTGIMYVWGTNWFGPTRLGEGAVPSVVATTALAVLLLLDRAQSRWLAYVPPSLVVLLLARYVYLDTLALAKDGSTSSATTVVEVSYGPFKYLKTSAKKELWLRELSRDVARWENSKGRIFFYPHFPAGYLLTKMRPATRHAIISCWMPNCSTAKEDYQARYHPNNLVVRVDQLYYDDQTRSDLTYPPDHDVDKYVRENHQQVGSGSFYRIFTGHPTK